MHCDFVSLGVALPQKSKGRGAKRGGAREHCSKKEMDRIIPGRRIWSISTALVAILINRAIYPSVVEVLIKIIFFCEIDI